MPQIVVLEINEITGKANTLKQIEVAGIPSKGDKVVLDLDDSGYVLNVVEVHYTDNEGVFVYVNNKIGLTEYMGFAFSK